MYKQQISTLEAGKSQRKYPKQGTWSAYRIASNYGQSVYFFPAAFHPWPLNEISNYYETGIY